MPVDSRGLIRGRARIRPQQSFSRQRRGCGGRHPSRQGGKVISYRVAGRAGSSGFRREWAGFARAVTQIIARVRWGKIHRARMGGPSRGRPERPTEEGGCAVKNGDLTASAHAGFVTKPVGRDVTATYAKSLVTSIPEELSTRPKSC